MKKTDSYKKIINWLYSKGNNASDFQKALRLYMFLKWSREELVKLKVKIKKYDNNKNL